MPERPPYYLTTPIYYVNARPHLGTAYSTIVTDTIARYKRAQGFDVFFLTGTDEHGQKIQRSARAMNCTPQEFVDKVAAEFRALWDKLGLTYNDFIRTTEPRHKQSVQRLFTLLKERGYIYKGFYTGQYCVTDEAWVDVGPGEPCPDCGRITETVTEENYFFKLSAFERKLLEYYEQNPTFIRPDTRRNEVISFVRSGLRDLSISRTSFSWGIPVPGDEKHVVYVWMDALANYITALGWGSDDDSRYQRFWADDRLRPEGAPLHIIGKEISRFHCVYWPAFLMAAGLPLPQSIFAHGWLLFDQNKMSKSRGNVVRAETIHDVLGNDALRYFLLREVVFGQDGNFTFEALVTALQRRPRQRLRQSGQPHACDDRALLRRRCAARAQPMRRCANPPKLPSPSSASGWTRSTSLARSKQCGSLSAQSMASSPLQRRGNSARSKMPPAARSSVTFSTPALNPFASSPRWSRLWCPMPRRKSGSSSGSAISRRPT